MKDGQIYLLGSKFDWQYWFVCLRPQPVDLPLCQLICFVLHHWELACFLILLDTPGQWRNLEDDHTGQVRMVCSKQCLRHIVFYNSCISGAASNVSLLSSVTVLSISKSFSIIIVSLGFRSSCKTFLWSVTIDPTVELQPQGLLHPRDRFNILYASLVMASWQCPCQIVPSWPRPSPPSDCRARPSLPPRRPAVCLC